MVEELILENFVFLFDDSLCSFTVFICSNVFTVHRNRQHKEECT